MSREGVIDGDGGDADGNGDLATGMTKEVRLSGRD